MCVASNKECSDSVVSMVKGVMAVVKDVGSAIVDGIDPADFESSSPPKKSGGSKGGKKPSGSKGGKKPSKGDDFMDLSVKSAMRGLKSGIKVIDSAAAAIDDFNYPMCEDPI